MSACVGGQGRKKEGFPQNTSSQRASPGFGCIQPVLPTPAPPHSLHPCTWICCTMLRSCTRNSLASLALSDNPFSAWESWLCGEKEGKPELQVHRAMCATSKPWGSQTLEPLVCSESSCLGLWGNVGSWVLVPRQAVLPWAPRGARFSLRLQMFLATGVNCFTS